MLPDTDLPTERSYDQHVQEYSQSLFLTQMNELDDFDIDVDKNLVAVILFISTNENVSLMD